MEKPNIDSKMINRDQTKAKYQSLRRAVMVRKSILNDAETKRDMGKVAIPREREEERETEG